MASILDLITKEVIKETVSALSKINLEKALSDLTEKVSGQAKSEINNQSNEGQYSDIEANKIGFDIYSDKRNEAHLNRIGKTTADLWDKDAFIYDDVRINEQWHAYCEGVKHYKSTTKNCSTNLPQFKSAEEFITYLTDLLSTKK